MSNEPRRSGAWTETEITVVVAIVAVIFFWKPIFRWLGDQATNLLGSDTAQQVIELAPVIVAGLVALVALWVWLSILTRGRRTRREMIAGAIGTALPAGWDSDHGVRVRWRPFTWIPAAIRVAYPPSFPDRDPEKKQALLSAIVYRAGMPAWESAWNPARLTVVVTRRALEDEVAATELELNRATQLVRVEEVLAPIFGTQITLTISTWVEPEPTKSADESPEEREPVPVGGYPARIEIQAGAHSRDTSPAWRRRLEVVTALKVPPGDARWIGIYRTAEDRVILERRPPLPGDDGNGLPHPGPCLWADATDIVLPYGITERGDVASWALTGRAAKARPTVHTLVIGATGTGKTSVLRSLLVGATAQGVPVLNGDPKRIELTPFRGWPGVLAVASTTDDIALLIDAVYELQQYRYRLIEIDGVDPTTLPPLLVFLDELLVLRSSLKQWWNAHKADEGVAERWGRKTGTDHPVIDHLTELIVLARSANIRIVFGVQRPDADLFENGARDSLQHRISLGRLSQEGAKMLWNDSYTGTDTPLIAGRAMASPDGATPLETQMYWTPDPRSTDPDEARLMAQLRQAAARAFSGWETDAPAYQEAWWPEGLDVSELSALGLSRTAPGQQDAAIDHRPEPVSTTPLVEHGATTTQLVPADALVAADPDRNISGDRIVDEGQTWTVTEIEPIANPDDDELYDHLRVTLAGAGGTHVIETPEDGSFDRVIDVLDLDEVNP